MLHVRVLALAILVVVLGCGSRAKARPALQRASGSYARIDNALVFELPDSGGYLANSTAVDTSRILILLNEVFVPRPADRRPVFVHDNSKRPWSDVEFLVRKSQEAGVAIFDADSSGFRRVVTAGSQVK